MKTYHSALAELFKQAAMSHDLTLTGIASKLLELSTEPVKALEYWRKAKEYASKAVDTLTVQEIEDYLKGEVK